MSNPDVNHIVYAWLKANGYDGLSTDDECACLIDDLMPCGEPATSCEAGYRDEGHDGYDYCIVTEKPERDGSST